MKVVRIGSGAGYGGDRLEPALELMERGNLDYIGFECLAERTIAIAQQQKLWDSRRGYNELLEYRMRKILPLACKNKVRVITNMGAANPVMAAEVVARLATKLGITGLKIAAVIGDDILDRLNLYYDAKVMETGQLLGTLSENIISANAYMGIDGIVEALRGGAQIIITGRVSDPALFLAPLVYEFGWSQEDYVRLGKGTVAGHLLECGGQVTGGYYADPGIKDVDNLAELGFPVAEVGEEGDFVITKLPGTGGTVSRHTCAEQLVYEIHDPNKYITPDCVVDFTGVTLTEIGPDTVMVNGASGRPKTGSLKVSIGHRDGFIGEGGISYGGRGCLERGRLAADIIRKRLEIIGCDYDEIRFDIMGVDSLYRRCEKNDSSPSEIRLRVAARTRTREAASLIGNEVEALYTNGPSAGGGATKSVREIVSVKSVLVPRDHIQASVTYMEG